jgi:hypothetical protein
LGKSLEHRDETEHEHAEREPEVGTELLQKDVGRDLEEDIRDEKDDESGTVLVGIDTEVNLKSINSCVGDVHTRPQSVPTQGEFERSIPV